MLSLFPIALVTVIIRRFFEVVRRQPSPPPLNIGSYTSAFVIFSALILYFYTHAYRGTVVSNLGSNVKKPIKDKRVGRNANYVHKRNSVPGSWFLQNARGSRENQKKAVRYIGEQFLSHLNESDSQLSVLNSEVDRNHDPVIVSKISALPSGGGSKQTSTPQQARTLKFRSNLTKLTLDSFDEDDDLSVVAKKSKSGLDLTRTTLDSFGFDKLSKASTSSNVNSQHSGNDLDVGIYGAILETKSDDEVSDGSSVFFLDKPRENTVDISQKTKRPGTASPRKGQHDRGDTCREANKIIIRRGRNRRKNSYFVRGKIANRTKHNNIAKTTRSGRVYGFFEN